MPTMMLVAQPGIGVLGDENNMVVANQSSSTKKQQQQHRRSSRRGGNMMMLTMRIMLIVVFLIVASSKMVIMPVQAQTAGAPLGLLAALPFTRNGSLTALHEGRNNMGYSHAAAVLLALDHFENRNSTTVPELNELFCRDHQGEGEAEGESSTTTTTTTNTPGWAVKLVDSESSGRASVRAVAEAAREQQQKRQQQIDAAGVNTAAMVPLVDAVVGGYYYGEEAGLELAMISSSLRIPLVAYGGSNLRVVNPHYYPYSARTYPDALAVGERLVQYVVDNLGRTNYFGLLVSAVSEVARQNQQVLVEATFKRNIETAVVSYTADDYLPGRPLRAAMEEVCDFGYRTIFLVLDDWELELPAVAKAASELEMLTDRYVWVLVGALNLEYFRNIDGALPPEVVKLATGGVTIQPLEGFGWFEDDPFLLAWKDQDAGTVRRLNAMLPEHVEYKAEPDYFQRFNPEPGAGFCYDAVMSMLMASCLASADDSAQGRLRALQEQVEFHGASALVRFGQATGAYPGSRASYTVNLGAYNLLPPDGSNDPFRLVAVRSGRESFEQEDRAVWMEKPMPFVFAGGSTTPPGLLRNEPEMNFIARPVHIWALTLFAVCLLVIIGSAIWVFIKRKERIVLVSQPMFIYGLLLGSLAVSLCIFTTSFDESYGWTPEQLSKACTATPWLFIFGIQLIYSSLFCQLYRINEVLQFRRRAVSVKSVMGPAASLFVVVLLILANWTAVAGGFTWVRTIHNPATGESSAKCQGQDTLAWFTPIVVLTALPVLLTAFMAWKTKDIDSDYADTGHLFSLILFQVQLLVISIPILFLVEDNSSSVRTVWQTFLYFLFSLSPVAFIIWPRVYRYYSGEDDQAQLAKRRGTRSNTRESIRISGIRSSSTARTLTEGTGGFRDSVRGSVTSFQTPTLPAVIMEASKEETSTTEVKKNVDEGISKTLDEVPAASAAAIDDDDVKKNTIELSTSSTNSSQQEEEV